MSITEQFLYVRTGTVGIFELNRKNADTVSSTYTGKKVKDRNYGTVLVPVRMHKSVPVHVFERIYFFVKFFLFVIEK